MVSKTHPPCAAGNVRMPCTNHGWAKWVVGFGMGFKRVSCAVSNDRVCVAWPNKESSKGKHMTYNAEQITYMLAEAIDQNREYKSWHCSTQHLMALVERVVAEEREACANTAGLALLGADKALSDRVLKAIRARGQA